MRLTGDKLPRWPWDPHAVSDPRLAATAGLAALRTS